MDSFVLSSSQHDKSNLLNIIETQKALDFYRGELEYRDEKEAEVDDKEHLKLLSLQEEVKNEAALA